MRGLMGVGCCLVLVMGCARAPSSTAIAPVDVTAPPLKSVEARHEVRTGELLSTRAPSKGCNDRDIEQVSRWLDSNPHTPLALAGKVGVETPNSSCCAAWGSHDVSWTQVDQWGRDVSTAHVKDGVGYDVTQCYEFEFEQAKVIDPTRKGVGLYVSGDTRRHRPARPYVLSAQDEEMLRELVAPLYRAFQAPYPDRAPLAFYVHEDETKSSRYPVCAAYGGGLLAVMCKDGEQWKLTYLEHAILTSYDLGAQAEWLQRLNTPLSVFDMDGDGEVELVIHQTEGGSWHDSVVSYREHEYEPWSRVLQSVGGATI